MPWIPYPTAPRISLENVDSLVLEQVIISILLSDQQLLVSAVSSPEGSYWLDLLLANAGEALQQRMRVIISLLRHDVIPSLVKETVFVWLCTTNLPVPPANRPRVPAGKRIAVEVSTLDPEGIEVHGLTVHCVPTALFDEIGADRTLDTVSSPASGTIEQGMYMMWATRGPDGSPVTPFQTVEVWESGIGTAFKVSLTTFSRTSVDK
jgi:hypothetical protein